MMDLEFHVVFFTHKIDQRPRIVTRLNWQTLASLRLFNVKVLWARLSVVTNEVALTMASLFEDYYEIYQMLCPLCSAFNIK